MIAVCKRCLPRGWPTYGTPWSAFDQKCAVCERSKPSRDLFNVDSTAEQMRFESWRSTYEHGPRSER